MNMWFCYELFDDLWRSEDLDGFRFILRPGKGHEIDLKRAEAFKTSKAGAESISKQLETDCK